MGGVIPQPTKEQGMPVQAQHQQITLVSLYAFHDRLHFVPLNKFSRQDYPFPLSGRSGMGLQASVVVKGLLTEHLSSSRHLRIDVSSIRRQLLLHRHCPQFGVETLRKMDASE